MPPEVKKATASYQSRRRKPSDIVEGNEYLNALIYSKFGVGKTWLASSAYLVSEMRDILYVTVNKGESKSINPDYDIDIYEATDWLEMNRLYKFFKAHLKWRDIYTEQAKQELIRIEATLFNEDPTNIKEPRRYQTIIFDHITEIQKLGLYYLLNIDIEKTDLTAKFDKASWDEWNSILEMLTLMVRKFRDLQIHKIYLGQEIYTTDDTHARYYSVQLQGQAQQTIHAFFDMVGRYVFEKADTGNGYVRFLYLLPIGNIVAKHRFLTLKTNGLCNPTMADIYKLLKGGQK